MSLDKLREIEQAATPGPWHIGDWGENRGWVAFVDEGGASAADRHIVTSERAEDMNSAADGEFIAAARNTYAALLDVAEAAERVIASVYVRDAEAKTVPDLEDALDRLREVSP